MWIRKNEDEVRAMHDEALAKIDEGDLAGAAALAAQLEAIGWSGCFEIEALARRKAGDRSGALAALDRGIAVAPELWMLHQLRGNVLDELGQNHDAIAAYDRALACPEVSVATVRFNRAITRLAVGDAGGALADAEHVITEAQAAPFAGAALGVAVDALVRLSRVDDAIAIVDHMIGVADSAPTNPAVAALHATRARALLAAGRPHDEVAAACTIAIEGGAGGKDVAAVLAGLAVEDESSRVRFHAVLEVSLANQVDCSALPAGVTGYFRTMQITATTEDEARSLATSLEPRALLAGARVETLEVLGPDVSRSSRLVSASGRLYFGE